LQQKKRIHVTIRVDGSIAVHPEGYRGGKCVDATKFLESLGEKASQKLTADHSLKAAEIEQARQKR
jgi:hypothetical protein